MPDRKPSYLRKKDADTFADQIEVKQQRKIRSRRHRGKNLWFGLGMFGLVGWSVAIPTVIGIFIGIWIDEAWPSRYSWTLMMLFAGIAFGCLNAWFWVKREGGRED